MKLGEALRLRSDYYKKIDELRNRAVAGAQIQDGELAPDSPTELLAQIEQGEKRRGVRADLRQFARHFPFLPVDGNAGQQQGVPSQD